MKSTKDETCKRNQCKRNRSNKSPTSSTDSLEIKRLRERNVLNAIQEPGEYIFKTIDKSDKCMVVI